MIDLSGDLNGKRSRELTLVVGITLLAALLRFPLLGQVPPGLYRDEAINGLDALRVLNGATPVFFTANNGREPLFIYLVAGSVALLGRSALAVRMVSAVLGTLTVPATYLMGRRLFDHRIGLLTATITAITVWPINLSRVGFRAVAMPLFVALTVWAVWRAYQRSTRGDQAAWRWFALAGAFAGGMLYTYLAARFVAVGLLIFIGYLALRRILHPSELIARDSQFDVPWRGLLLFACVAVVIAGPLLGYFLTHRHEAAQRAYQVSIFNPDISGGDPLDTLLRHAGRTLLMFNVRGDFIPRHNVPLRPVFDPLLSLFFLAGVALAFRRWRQPAYGLALTWTATMLLPTLLAEDAPHFLRAVGVLPVLFVYPALGLSAFAQWLERRWSTKFAGTGVAIVLILALGLTVYQYFARHARSQDVYYQFEAGATELASAVNQFVADNPDGQAYVDGILWDGWAAVRFLAGDSPRITVVPSAAAPEPASRRVLVAVWPFQDLSPYFDLLPEQSTITVREGAKERGDLEPEARLLYVLYRAAPHTGDATPLALFGDSISLLEADLHATSDDELRVHLTWECRQRMPKDYAVTAQLLAPDGLLTQDDGPPASGYYPTTAWRPGDRVAEERTLHTPTPYDPQRHRLIIAVYDPATLQRMPAHSSDGVSLGDHYSPPRGN